MGNIKFFILYHLLTENAELPLLRLISERSYDVIIDLGCGEGDYLLKVAQAGHSNQLVGIDISLKSLNLLKERAKKLRSIFPDLIVADASFLPLHDESCGLIIIIGVLHHIKGIRVINEIARVIKKNGLVFIEEVVLNNPIGFLVSKLTKIFPNNLLKRIPEKYFDPQIFLRTANWYKSFFLKVGFRAIQEERLWVFMFILGYASTMFPAISKLLPNRFLFALWDLEKFLVSGTPFKHMCKFIRLTLVKS